MPGPDREEQLGVHARAGSTFAPIGPWGGHVDPHSERRRRRRTTAADTVRSDQTRCGRCDRVGRWAPREDLSGHRRDDGTRPPQSDVTPANRSPGTPRGRPCRAQRAPLAGPRPARSARRHRDDAGAGPAPDAVTTPTGLLSGRPRLPSNAPALSVTSVRCVPSATSDSVQAPRPRRADRTARASDHHWSRADHCSSAGRCCRSPADASSAVVMRRVPFSFQVARGAWGPVSRGTSTVMSTNS